MVQFDATRRTLPGLERLVNGGGNIATPQGGPVEVLHGCRQLVSFPQRAQPLSCVAIIQLGTRRRPPAISWRKVGMTSSPHGLYVQGYTRATMDGTNRRKPARGSQSEKTVLSSDCRLQLACMKLESLVMADQHAAVNTFPGLVHTARHITKVDCTRSLQADPQGGQRPKV